MNLSFSQAGGIIIIIEWAGVLPDNERNSNTLSRQAESLPPGVIIGSSLFNFPRKEGFQEDFPWISLN